MSDDYNLDILHKDVELEKLCTNSVELINYARNIVVNHVNIVQIMTYYSLGRWIVETQQMGEKRAKYGSKVIKTYPITVGKMVTPTPPGSYTIINKDTNPPPPFGVLWMGLSRPHYGIHGTNDPSSIGKNQSHGCIRMYNDDVLELSSKTPIGTTVWIHQ